MRPYALAGDNYLVTPDRDVVRRLKKLDNRISVAWDGGRHRWQILYKRRLPPEHERKKFEHVCTFYRNGNQYRISEARPADLHHIVHYEWDDGSFRQLDSHIVTKMQEWDTWRHHRVNDLWLRQEFEQDLIEERRQKKMHDDHYSMALDNDGQFRREFIGNAVDTNRTHWAKHHRANVRVGIDF